MTILDVAIVNVAIPSIQKDLNIAESTVQWVITAYAITFGGFLLLGGRMSDLLGRRRIFIVGLVLFTLASLACGLANSAGVLIASRAVQGLGAAIISPAALSIVTTTFEEGADRNKALGIWGALGGSGAAVGVLLGGILTKYLGWEWIFFVNVPVGALVLALTRPIVPESRADLGHRRFDAVGAVSVTGGNALFIYAISKAPDVGWGTGSHDRPAHCVARHPCLLRRLGTAHRGSARPVRHLSHPHADRRERRRVPARRLDLRELLHPHAVRPAGPRLVGAEDGSHVPRHGGHHRDLGRRRTGARDQGRAPVGHDGRDGGSRADDARLHATAGGRKLLARSPPAVSHLRARARVRVHPGHDRRVHRRPARSRRGSRRDC